MPGGSGLLSGLELYLGKMLALLKDPFLCGSLIEPLKFIQAFERPPSIFCFSDFQTIEVSHLGTYRCHLATSDNYLVIDLFLFLDSFGDFYKSHLIPKSHKVFFRQDFR